MSLQFWGDKGWDPAPGWFSRLEFNAGWFDQEYIDTTVPPPPPPPAPEGGGAGPGGTCWPYEWKKYDCVITDSWLQEQMRRCKPIPVAQQFQAKAESKRLEAEAKARKKFEDSVKNLAGTVATTKALELLTSPKKKRKKS